MQYKLNEKTKSTSTSEQFQNPIEKILETEAKWKYKAVTIIIISSKPLRVCSGYGIHYDWSPWVTQR
jgi:hypothetical protein